MTYRPSSRPQARPGGRAGNGKRKKSKKGIVALIIIVVVLLCIYCGGIFLSHKYFQPNTYVGETKVSYMESEEADSVLLPDNTEFTLTKIDGEESIELSDINYTTRLNTPSEELIESQNHFAWPLSFLKKNVIENEVVVSYDKDALEEVLKNLDAFNPEKVIEPQDAHLKKGSDGHYSIIPEVSGNKLSYENTLKAVTTALDKEEFSADVSDKANYAQPKVFSDNKNLTETLEKIKIVNEATITIDLVGAVEVLTPLDLLEFVIINDDSTFTVNEDYLYEYVRGLDAEYDTYMTKRDFTTHSGEVIKVGGATIGAGINGDTYGFLMDEAPTRDLLREAIYSGETQTIEAVWEVPAIARDEPNGDIGGTYIEISISEQHLWFYIDGKVHMETDCITGLPDGKRDTPKGVYRIYEKDEDAHLTGDMAGDTWDTYVKYWMSINWTGCGLHDATWRYEFGGDIYTWGGSHGCVNLPYDAAETIFFDAEINTPVIIY